MAESVGEHLREAREARGLTLEDVERATRIRVKYLAAIEADEFEAIPSAVQARGFLRNYSQYLGLDADELLAEYDAPARRVSLGQLARALVRPRPSRPAQPAPPPVQPASQPPPQARPIAPARRGVSLRLRAMRWLSADVLVGVLVVAALAGFFVWGGSRLAAGFFQATAEATVIELGRPQPSATLAASAIAGETAVAVVLGTPPPTAPAQPVALTNVPVTLQFEQTAWVLVIVDGSEAFRGLVGPGNSQEYLGQNSVEVFTGNGAGVRIIYGGADLGPMGSFGEVVYRIYTLIGVVTPTASPAPEMTDTHTPRPETATPTPRPTVTPGSSQPATAIPTLAPTATPRPTETVPPSPTGTP